MIGRQGIIRVGRTRAPPTCEGRKAGRQENGQKGYPEIQGLKLPPVDSRT